MVRGFVTARVSRQHESQQIHGPPTSYDTGPDFTRNHEEPPMLIGNGNRAYSRANLRDRHSQNPPSRDDKGDVAYGAISVAAI